MYHQASGITASMHRIEAQTRTAEQNMVDAYKIANATTTHNIHKARHHIPLVDAYILNIAELMWKSQTYPGVRGDIPMARIHFSVSCIGKYFVIVFYHRAVHLLVFLLCALLHPLSADVFLRSSMLIVLDNKFTRLITGFSFVWSSFHCVPFACLGHMVFLMGGAEPTSLRYKHIEHDGQTCVYVLDSRTMKWTIHHASNSADHLKEPIRIAHADVIRALKRCDAEKLRGIALGKAHPFCVLCCLMLLVWWPR